MSRIRGCLRLRDPCLDMPYPIRIAGSLQSPSVRILYRILAQDPCVGILSEIHVSGPFIRSKLQNFYTGAMRVDSLQGTCARSMLQDLCKIHECGPATRSMSARSGPPGPLEISRRSMPPDPYLRFHMCESSTRCISPDLYLSILICGPCARSLSQDTLWEVFRADKTQVLNSRDTFFIFFCRFAHGKHSDHDPPKAANLNRNSPLPLP